MIFVFGLVYQWLQTVISFRIYKAELTQHCGLCVLSLRVLIPAMSTSVIIIGLNIVKGMHRIIVNLVCCGFVSP